jgi:outer membrane protein TolC
MAVFGTSASVFAQAPQPSQQPAAAPALSRRLTADEAVKLALENNLGIRVARIDPQVQDLNIVNAKTGWTPNFSTTIQTQSNDAPNQNFLAGGQGTRTESDQFAGNIGIAQTLPWGGNYDIGWDSSRFNSNSSFSTFSPQLRSSFAVNYSQPLLRNWKIDNTRQQVLITSKNREIADVSVRQTVATTTRNVRNAFWDLAYTIASLGVQQQSLDLAQESLRDTRARVEIGTTPPIDIVQAEAEVARRREAVIVAEGQIGDAEMRFARSSSIPMRLTSGRSRSSQRTFRRMNRSWWTRTGRCETRSVVEPTSNSRASQSRPTTSTFASTATRCCRISARS